MKTPMTIKAMIRRSGSWLSAMAAAVMMLSSCSDDNGPDGPVEPFSTDDFVVESTGDVVDLQAANDEGGEAVVGCYTLSNWPKDATMNLELVFSATQDMIETVTMPATLGADGKILASPDLLDGAFRSLVSRNPAPRSVWLGFYASTDASDVDIPADHMFGPYVTLMKPFAPETVIEEAYYLLTNLGNWGDNPRRFEHSDIDQYDDPVFSLTINLTQSEIAEGMEWVIVGESALADMAGGNFESFYPDGKGHLIASTGTSNHGTLSEGGNMLLTIDMAKRTYDLNSYYPYLYTPGLANGFTAELSQRLQTTDNVNYRGFFYADLVFKFSATLDWQIAWGQGAEPGTLSPDGGDISVDGAGLFYGQVNLKDLTYGLTKVMEMSVTGTGLTDGAVALTPVAQGEVTAEQKLIWRATNVKFGATGTWRIAANGGSVNLGGAVDNLVPGGNTVESPGAGNYTVTLDLSTLPYMVNIERSNN